MPVVQPSSVPARALHSRDGTFLRRDAKEILLPEDLSEQAGDLHTLNKEGFPLSVDGTPYFEIRSVENPDGWSPYIGTASQGVNGPTKQVSSALPIARNSFMANQPPLQGDLPPGLLAAAKIPRPLAPLLVAEPAGVEGYAAGPETSPYYVAFTWVRGARHSELSPFTRVPAVEFGQSIRAILASEIPEGVDGIGIWLTEPGTSTPSLPGPLKLQRVVDVSRYNPGTYDLTGPYRHEKSEPSQNETLLPTPGEPNLTFRSANKASRPGTYYAAATWVDANGESLGSSTSTGVTITPSPSFTDDEGNPIAGSGYLTATRPSNPPPGATGWRAYIYIEGQWHVVYNTFFGFGNEKPLPIGFSQISFGGWSSASDSEWSTNDNTFLVQRDLPTENTSGIETPTEPLEEPVVFGVVRYPAGTYYAGITESVRGLESVLSPTASITINSNEVLRVIRQDRVNLIPNAGVLEVGADGLPLDRTIVTTGGSVVVEASTPTEVLRTSGAQTGTTPSSTTRAISVNDKKWYRVGANLYLGPPALGVFSGSAEVVLEQVSASGSVTQTVIGTLTAVGHALVEKSIYPSNTGSVPAGSMKWLSTTRWVRVLVRFSGSTKNLTIGVAYRQLHVGLHDPRRYWRELGVIALPGSPSTPGQPPGLDPPDPPIDPPGTEVGIVLPPVIPPTYEPIAGPTPALVEWGAVDRPSSSGVLLEAKHDFETAIPARWKQHANGASVTLTRYATNPLAGTNSLRSYKAS